VASTRKDKSLGIFLETIAQQGGMSYSNNFDVEFVFPSPTGANKDLLDRFNGLGLKMTATGMQRATDEDMDTTTPSLMKMFCEEAQLPNVQAATGQLSGYRMGEGSVNYAHTKLYTDFQLGWMCDANMTPLKFLNAWYGFIFSEYDPKGQEVLGESGSGTSAYSVASQSLEQLKNKDMNGTRSSADKSIRLRFPEEYQCNVTIVKTEKGDLAPNQRSSMMYTLMDVFPYSIDAVPLSYGASQITKVTANFYYSKYSIIYNDVTQWRGKK